MPDRDQRPSAQRPRGRPRLDDADTSVSVHFRLPTKDYDDTLAAAARERESLADYIRRRLLRKQL